MGLWCGNRLCISRYSCWLCYNRWHFTRQQCIRYADCMVYTVLLNNFVSAHLHIAVVNKVRPMTCCHLACNIQEKNVKQNGRNHVLKDGGPVGFIWWDDQSTTSSCKKLGDVSQLLKKLGEHVPSAVPIGYAHIDLLSTVTALQLCVCSCHTYWLLCSEFWQYFFCLCIAVWMQTVFIVSSLAVVLPPAAMRAYPAFPVLGLPSTDSC